MTLLRGQIMDIEVQLGDRDRRTPDTKERLTPEAWKKWRQGAKWAIRYRAAEVAYLEEWIGRRERNRLEACYRRLQLDPESPDSLLAAAYHVLRGLVRERRVTLDQDEQAVLDATSRHFGPIIQANGRVVPPTPVVIRGREGIDNGGATGESTSTAV